MERKVSFQVEEAVEIPKWSEKYPEHKFSIFRCCFLSSAPNSHKLEIDDKTLRKYAPTILGNFLVAKLDGHDATSHADSEVEFGYFPIEQKVEFVEENGVTKAYAYAVISKMYGKDFNAIFEEDNFRNTSVEMSVITENDEDEGKVESFDIYALTCLGKTTNGSCPDAMMTMVRFSKDEAESFFTKSAILSDLEKFVENRKKSMAEKYVSHPVNASKDAIYKGEWDGDKAKQDLVKEKNYKTLAPKVCLRLEPGWEDREVTKLGYPVMGLYDGEWRYSAKALASAQGYAEKENETEVLKKIKAIKKKLGLDDSDGKEETKMAEKDTEKVDMEEETKVDETKETEMEETVVKAEDCPCDEDDKHDTEEHEDFEAKCAQLTKDIEERDNIIMQKDEELKQCQTELAELREYKRCMEASQLACKVEAALSEIKGFASESQIDAFREECKNCTLDNIDAFVNKVKATCFDATKGNLSKSDDGMFKFSIPVVTEKKSESVWDRL